MKPTVYILYHFFHPDTVVSAELKKGLAQGLVARGWDVTVVTSNRFCRDQEAVIECLDEAWGGMRIIRVPRKQYDQRSMLGRLKNSYVIQRGWLTKLKQLPAPDALILGTDPQFSQLMLPSLRRIYPSTKLGLWVFDLYPEILEAQKSRWISLGAKLLRRLLKRFYRPVDLIADIGPCMKQRLRDYAPGAVRETLVPWALAESETGGVVDAGVRAELFGDAKVGVLYSGTIGQAHTFDKFLELARLMRRKHASVAFCFAGHGNRYAEVEAMVDPSDTNIRFVGFCPLSELGKRLSAADFHMISLKEGWEGTVVPSKFFGALAAGRPVLYDGAPGSDIGIWIRELNLGFNLGSESLESIAKEMNKLGECPEHLKSWQGRVLDSYQKNFSYDRELERWEQVLRLKLER